jgi:hypothetical protein
LHASGLVRCRAFNREPNHCHGTASEVRRLPDGPGPATLGPYPDASEKTPPAISRRAESARPWRPGQQSNSQAMTGPENGAG